MNLAALPKDSEELGLAGYGACRVELYPIESADEVTGRQVLDLDGVGDEAHDLDVSGPPSADYLTLSLRPMEAADEA